MLKLAAYRVEPAFLGKVRAGLFEMKTNAFLPALLPQGKHPCIIAYPGIVSRLAAYDDAFDHRRQIGRQIDRAQQRFTDDAFMPDRFLKKNGQLKHHLKKIK